MARSKTKNKADNSKDGRKKRLARKNNSQPSWDDSQDLNAQLRRLNLCTKDIAGDGNCLFRSLSDQYYGNDSQHKSIRQEICTFLEEHEEEYKYFVEDDVPFDKHVSDMKRNGTFGGNMELAAFARLKKVDIKIYQPGLIYIINGTDTQDDNGDDDEENEERRILHIAYHSWEHYSSVRNIDGPSTGPPEIKASQQEGNEDSGEYEDNDDNAKKEDSVDIEKGSKEKAVLSACPTISPRRIKRLLIKHKGDVDKVINLLYEEMDKAEEDNTNATTIEEDSSKPDKPAESTITTELTDPIKLSKTTTTESDEKTDQVTSKKSIESVEKLEENVNETSNINTIQEKAQNESLDDPNKNIKSDDTIIETSKEKEDSDIENTKKEEKGEKEEKARKDGDEDGEENEKDDDKEKNNNEIKKPKKPTARQRKLEAKKRQKELQEAKKKAKAERKTKRAQEKLSDDTTDDTETASATSKHLSSSMKELHI